MSQKNSIGSLIALGVFVLSYALMIAGARIPTQSRLLFGISFFNFAILLLGAGVHLFWHSWIRPTDSKLLKERYRAMKAAWGPFSWLWLLPESLYPMYLRFLSVVALLVGLFVFIMVVDHYLLGHQFLVIQINLPK